MMIRQLWGIYYWITISRNASPEDSSLKVLISRNLEPANLMVHQLACIRKLFPRWEIAIHTPVGENLVRFLITNTVLIWNVGWPQPRSQAYPVFSVLWFALTIIHGCGRAVKASVLLSTQTEKQKKQGRPGNEARMAQ